MVVLTWILSIAGLIVAYIVSLAGAMKTVPHLSWREAIVGVPLPVIAGLLAGWCLVRSTAPTARRLLSAGGPLLLALLALLLLAVSYFDQPR